MLAKLRDIQIKMAKSLIEGEDGEWFEIAYKCFQS